MTFKVPEKYRIRIGSMASTQSYGCNGAFDIKSIKLKAHAIAGDGAGWEHVSVSLQHRCPTWEEMCFVKSLFWDKEDCVIQFHPSEKDYVNCHPYCLHLWRQKGIEFITPPTWMIA